MLTTKYPSESDLSFINKLLELDSYFYSEVYQWNLEYAKARYKKNKETIILLYNNENIIGYVCTYPIDDYLYNNIKEGKIESDVDFPIDHILNYEENKTYNLYICSILIDEKFHNTEAIQVLLNGFVDYLLELKRNNININKLLAITVSEDGEKLANKLGFKVVKEIKEDSCVMETTFNDIINSIIHK